jgi:hypothetical protein
MWLLEDVTSKLFHMAGISRQQFYIPLVLISICPFIIYPFPLVFPNYLGVKDPAIHALP